MKSNLFDQFHKAVLFWWYRRQRYSILLRCASLRGQILDAQEALQDCSADRWQDIQLDLVMLTEEMEYQEGQLIELTAKITLLYSEQ